jgi:hypothetical protein
MIVRKLRLKRAWSQEQLVFEIELEDLQEEKNMLNSEKYSEEENRVIEHVKEIKDFYSHLINYVVVIIGLFIVNFITSPDYYWAWWAAFGWGIGVVSHGMSVFEVYSFFGADWEKKQIEKRLGKKL